VQYSFNCPKNFWNWLFGMANSCIITFHFIYSISWNLFPFNNILTFGNRKKSGEYGGCSTCGIWCLAKTFWTEWDEWVGWCSCQSPCFHDAGHLHHTASCSWWRTSTEYSLLTVWPSGAYSCMLPQYCTTYNDVFLPFTATKV
jgi:hypothetical protein